VPRLASALLIAAAAVITLALALVLLPLIVLAAAWLFVKASVARVKHRSMWRGGRRNVRVIPHDLSD
jgi:hypothetical protein